MRINVAFTQYVLLLTKLNHCCRYKGSDASWKGNNEPPVQFIDFSDDEDEKRSRRKRTVISILSVTLV
jgi:hypothetical protein